MKKHLRFFSIILILVIMLVFSGATANSLVPLYCDNGTVIEVDKNKINEYLNNGYYKSRSDAVVTLYAPDGKTLDVYRSEEEVYLSLGWYKTYEEVTERLYDYDGNSVILYLSEIDDVIKQGWYHRYEDAVTTVYAYDNSPKEIFKGQLYAHLNGGYRLNPSPDPSKPTVAFTFDDGPHPSNTKVIIDILKKYNSTATFYTLGNLASRYPNIVKYTVDNGMEIASHTYAHAKLTSLSLTNLLADIGNASSSIYNACGVYPKTLRPPYGATNDTVKYNAGLPLVLWSVDTLDWKHRNAQIVSDYILNTVKDGDIVLLHDIHQTTAEAMKIVIPELTNRGFNIVSVSTLALMKGINLSAGNVYTRLK